MTRSLLCGNLSLPAWKVNLRDRFRMRMTLSSKTNRPLRLLHTSDLHICDDIYPEDTLRGFETVLALARQTRADAILVAGDLFDTHRVPPEILTAVLDKLGTSGCPVIILPGNHDIVLFGIRNSTHLPDNVTIIKQAEGETVHLRDLGLAVWGRPVYDHHPGFRPLDGLPPRPHKGWYVVMAHGIFMGPGIESYRSSQITPEELAQADCDYVALGHIHLFRDVTQGAATACYSGAPSGPQPKSVALVTLDPKTGTTATPLTIS